MPKPPPPWLEEVARALDDAGALVFGASELNRLLAEKRDMMQLPADLAQTELMKAVVGSGLVRKEKLLPLSRPKSNDGTEYRIIEKYLRKRAFAVHVALSLRPNSYISHASAAEHHGLIPSSHDRIYVNKEQSSKPETGGTLAQEAIDRAFANGPRISNLVYGFKKTEIVLLSGKNTGNHDVTGIDGKLGNNVAVTSIERTLVDMTVRPVYAGGVQRVLSAFLAARATLSIPRIVRALEALRYIYPYHQAVGFFLQRAGLSDRELAPLKKFPINFNFYSMNQIDKPKLDPVWRVFYPEALDSASELSPHVDNVRKKVTRKQPSARSTRK